MAAREPVTPAQHANRYWRPSPDYAFAAGDPMATLVAAELTKACMHLPLGFSQINGAFVPVALQGLRAGQNLCVDANGRWRADYIPAVYRGYPFTLGRSGERHVLCVNGDSGLLSDSAASHAGNQLFFDDQNKPTERINEIVQFLEQVQQSRTATQAQCAVLQQHELIEPWPLTVQNENASQALQGLYRLNESALNALSTEAFAALRQAGALPMVYSQLLSMQHISRLGALARADAGASVQAEAEANTDAEAKSNTQSLASSGDDVDLEFLNHNGTISFH